MKIEFCCTNKYNTLNICHHNIKIDGEKYHIVDNGCRISKEDIKRDIDMLTLTKGWVDDCDNNSKCEVL